MLPTSDMREVYAADHDYEALEKYNQANDYEVLFKLRLISHQSWILKSCC